jgi:hypothetical protein
MPIFEDFRLEAENITGEQLEDSNREVEQEEESNGVEVDLHEIIDGSQSSPIVENLPSHHLSDDVKPENVDPIQFSSRLQDPEINIINSQPNSTSRSQEVGIEIFQ